MNFVWGFLIGAAAAVAAAWFWYLPKINKKLTMCETNRNEVITRYSKLMGLVESVHSLAFGPYGVIDQAIVDAFNKLWRGVGLKENGRP